MKTLLNLAIPAFLLAPAILIAQTAQTSPLLDAVPEAVRAAVLKTAGDGRVDEVKTSTRDGQKVYLVEIDLKDDNDLDLQLAADGRILKSAEEVRLSAAPEAVRAALEKLAGTTARIEDLKKVTKGDLVTWQAELDRHADPDLLVKLDAEGKILEQKNENS